MLYFLLGVLAPILLNLLHMCIGIYICVARGSVMSLAFSGAGFFTKSIGIVLIMYLGIETFELNFKIFIPLLSLFFLMTHFIEAFVIQHYIQKNVKPYIQALQK